MSWRDCRCFKALQLATFQRETSKPTPSRLNQLSTVSTDGFSLRVSRTAVIVVFFR
jgi:hypothetical protein